MRKQWKEETPQILSEVVKVIENAQDEATKILDDGSVWISSEGEDVNVPFIYQVDFDKIQTP